MAYNGDENRLDREIAKVISGSCVENEVALSEISERMLLPCDPGPSYHMIENLINLTYRSTELDKHFKTLMLRTLEDYGTTRLFDYLEMLEDVSKAILVGPRVFRYHKGKNLLHLAKIEGRNAYVLTNKVGLTPGEKNRTCFMFGRLVELDPTGFVIAKHPAGRSLHFNVSPEDLDWWPTLWSRAFAWNSLMNAGHQATDVVSADKMNDFLGMLLILSNDEPFAQMATAVRFMYINMTGFGSYMKDLYTKLSWFKPSSMPELLYSQRTLKMTTMGLLCRSRAIVTWVKGNAHGEVPISRIGQTIALPHQRVYVNSMNYVYNSFYLGKFLEYIRSNKVQKDAAAFIKIVENHHESILAGEPLDLGLAAQDGPLVDRFLQLDPRLPFGAHSPSLLTMGLAVELSYRKTKAISRRPPDLSIVFRATRVSDGFNSKGSVAERGKNGVAPDVIVSDKRDGQKFQKKLGQASKCYLTLAKNLCQMIENKPGATGPLREYKEEYDSPAISDHKELALLMRSNDIAINTIAFNQLHNKLYIARIFAKPEPGSRDIAILNAPMRLGCLLLENLARKCQEWERQSGDNTNLIEQMDKDEIAMASYMKSEHGGSMRFYDNEDHSKWGPATSLSGVYLAIARRCSSLEEKNVVASVLSSFSNKISKIPDKFNLFSRTHEAKGENIVSQALNLIQQGFEGFHRDHDCFQTGEGMFQGTLGCCSSVLAADILRLGSTVLEVVFKYVELV